MGAKIAVGQFHSALHDVDANLEKAARMVAGAKAQDAQLVVLPETFASAIWSSSARRGVSWRSWAAVTA
jgi:predicted amidohydrolase